MPSFSGRVAETAEDGCSENTNEFINPADSAFAIAWIGRDNGSAFDIDGAWIWRGTGIPPGAPIISCTVTLVRQGAGSGSPQGDWWGFAVDSPTDFNAADVHRVSDHHARTTASVNGNISGDPATLVSPNLAAIAQEIVNRPGFNGDLGFAWRNTLAGADAWFLWTDFTTASGSAALLDVEWSAGTWSTTPALQQRLVRHAA